MYMFYLLKTTYCKKKQICQWREEIYMNLVDIRKIIRLKKK